MGSYNNYWLIFAARLGFRKKAELAAKIIEVVATAAMTLMTFTVFYLWWCITP